MQVLNVLRYHGEYLTGFNPCISRRKCILYLEAAESIIPWCFAYDRTNYSRHLPWYVHSMKDLQTSNPPVWEYLKDGGFSVQMSTTDTFGRIPMDHLEGFPWIIWKDSHGSFGRIPMDQAIEETANKDTQTPAGTTGFSLKHNAV